MGKVLKAWRAAFSVAGYDFRHIGSDEVRPGHPLLFPFRARAALKAMRIVPDVLLVHEPASHAFVDMREKLIVFSHGLERRGWEILSSTMDTQPASFVSRLIHPLWRIAPGEIGLRHARGLLLINSEDACYCENRYGRLPSDIYVFKNAAERSMLRADMEPTNFTALFIGMWLRRKGVHILCNTARICAERGLNVQWHLAGVSREPEDVLSDWHPDLRASVRITQRFVPEELDQIFGAASTFVLPSLYEGQPLALLEAMSAGRCCIASDCCGQKDLIQSGVNGLLVAADDAFAYADALRACAISPATRMAYGKAAQSSIMDRTWSSVAEEVVAAVERFCYSACL